MIGFALLSTVVVLLMLLNVSSVAAVAAVHHQYGSRGFNFPDDPQPQPADAGPGDLDSI